MMPPPTRPVVSGSGSGSEAAAVSSSGGTGDSILEGGVGTKIYLFFFFQYRENLI
jgi:hypothetical protein